MLLRIYNNVNALVCFWVSVYLCKCQDLVLLHKNCVLNVVIHCVFNVLFGYHLKSNTKEKCQIPSLYVNITRNLCLWCSGVLILKNVICKSSTFLFIQSGAK